MRRPHGRRGREASQNGTALLVVVGVTVVLVALALAINRKIQNAMETGRHEVARTVALETAAGAVHTAMAVLAEDKRTSQADSLAELWADEVKVGALVSVGLPEGATVKVRINDERAKIQVNALVDVAKGQQTPLVQQQLWERFLSLPDFEELAEPDMTPAMIIGALKDWIDRADDDATTGLSGAENPYYEGLPVPYRCRNGPLLDVEEMVLVRGIRRPLLDGDAERPGIGGFLTVYAMNTEKGNAQEGAYDGRININTASLTVLTAMLPEEYRDLATAIDEYRRQAVADDAPEVFTEPLWYRNAPGCQSLTIEPELITTASDHFRIQATAEYAGVRANLNVVIERRTKSTSAKTDCRILSWQPF